MTLYSACPSPDKTCARRPSVRITGTRTCCAWSSSFTSSASPPQLPPRTVCCASSASATSASSTHGLLRMLQLMDTSSLPGLGRHDHVDPQPRPRRVCPRLKLMMMMLVPRLARDQSSKGHTVLYAARPQGRNKKPPTRKEPQNTQQFTLRGRYIRRHCAVRMSSFKLVVNASRKRRL